MWLLRRGQIAGRGALDATASAPSTITWDSGKKNAAITLSNGNLTGSIASNTFYATMLGNGSGVSSGKKYFELTITTINPDGQGIGFGNASTNLAAAGGGNDLNSIGWRRGGTVAFNNSAISTIQTFAQGDVLAMAVDFTGQLVWFRHSNSLNWNNNGSADPATGTGGIAFPSAPPLNAGPYFPATTLEIAADSFTANFGATAYAMTAPSGFGNW